LSKDGRSKLEREGVTLEKLVELSVRRGIIYPSGSIYGGIAGFFDWGPVGSELRRNILDSWWRFFVETREDVVGIHGSIITHPKVWIASGHVDEFVDIMVECKKCKSRFRADQLLEEKGIITVTTNINELKFLLREHNIACPKCGGELTEPTSFNLMFETFVGPSRDKKSVAYLRPETAQLIFIHFKDVALSARKKLPFGIAQIGRAFRNEISPRNFIFRMREFEQMELEFFINPEKDEECPYLEEVSDIKIEFLSASDQEKGVQHRDRISMKKAYETGLIKSKWHAYWLGKSIEWLISIGLSPDNLRVREHLRDELAHYAIQTFDIEYNFPFMGWKEIVGISNRGDYDLRRHSEYSGVDMSILEDGRRVTPYVIEPSFGLERITLAVLTDSYKVIDGRTVLSLNPCIAPYKVGVYPLLKREPFKEKAKKIFKELLTEIGNVFYDESGSIGKRYARSDEIGVPFGVTIDHQTLEDETITVRFRDTREQIRIKISQLVSFLRDKLKC